MTKVAVILGILVLVLLVHQLHIYGELKRWAKEMEETDGNSNLRLTTSLHGKSVKRLCQAFNHRLDEGQKSRLAAERSGRELKVTIASVSHDIRTPLTGAAGYLELLSRTEDPAKRDQYLSVIRRRLKELEGLLDELFLYTKLTQEEYHLDCVPLHPYPILTETLADFYDRLEEAGMEPRLSFPNEAWCVVADEDSLRRIFGNLIKNAIEHGLSPLVIEQKENKIIFRNHLKAGDSPEIDRLFDRFYKADPSRHDRSSGLGLFIVRQLMEKMGGSAHASLEEGELSMILDFPEEK